ncbi:ganglioside-induced differentiation-associated protein 1-like [Glandiceps talaboti]
MASTDTGKLMLYYHPMSYYSQRGRLSVEEKGLDCVYKVTDHHGGETLEPSYLKMNPKAQVPTLTFNGQNVPDSNEIVDFLDEQFPESPRLQPDEETRDGQKVRQWRNKINDVAIEIITFGCIWSREELTNNSLVPAIAAKMIKAKMGSDSVYKKYMKKYPDYKETYEMKIDFFKTFRQSYSDINIVRQKIEALDMTLDDIEKQLQETVQNFTEDDEYWFLGQTFTAADVFLAVLLNRLKFIGLLHHFQDSKPLLTAYYKRVQQRPSFTKACVCELPTMFKVIGAIQKMVPILMGIGLIGAALAFGYKYATEKNA